MFYVTEIQTNPAASTGAVVPFVFDNQPDAEAKYHELLSVAAKSSVPVHGVMLFTETQIVVKKEIYDRVNIAAE